MGLANVWNWQLALGSETNALLTFQQNGQPYTLPSTDWEYVVRGPSGGSNDAILFTLTTTATANGVLTIDVGAGTVYITVYAAATQPLSPGPYRHALWSDPGQPSATAWVSGAFQVISVPQP